MYQPTRNRLRRWFDELFRELRRGLYPTREAFAR